jgi:hypothetical protein
MNLQSGKNPNFENFKTLDLGVLGQNDIWVQPLWLGVENTIRGKVVAFPKSRPWWVLWVCASCYCLLSNNFLSMFFEAIGIMKQHMISWVIIPFTSSYVTYSSHNFFVQMFVDFGAIIKNLAIMMKVGNITYCVTLISRGYDYIHLSFV